MAAEIISKRCSKCKEVKPISEFSKDRKGKDGIRGYCKSCQKIYQQSENGKATHKRYQQSEKGKAAQKRHNRSEKGKKTLCRAKKHFNTNHPKQSKAISAVNNAITAGKLPRPDTLLCHYCPKPAQQYHHWHGYEKEHWLDVVPACVKCHNKLSFS